MNKFALLAAMSIAVVGAASAQAPKTKSIKCAVMTSSSVDIAKATKEKMYSDYKGRRYYFCCGGCPGAFKADPAKYAKNASLPTPKVTKK